MDREKILLCFGIDEKKWLTEEEKNTIYIIDKMIELFKGGLYEK